MSELVSIITPVYNSEKYLKSAYDSLINQSYQNFEWIIIDDCSTDMSFKLALSFAKTDKRIKVIKTKINSGAAVARNCGIKIASGKYIAFLDSDDIWKPNKLDIQIDFMHATNCAFSYGCYEVINKNKTITYFPKKEKSDYKDLLKTCDIGCLTVMLDISILGKILMPEDAQREKTMECGLI